VNETRGQPEKPRDGLSFIHSSLDDAGLTPAPFRIYCHVNRAAGRNGVCNQALSTIARLCGYGDETTRDALKILTARRMLRRNEIAGVGVEYRLNPPAQWLTVAPTPPPRKNRRGRKPKGSPAGKPEAHPSEKIGVKGIPDEGIHRKVLKGESNKPPVVIKDLHPGLTEMLETAHEVLGANEMKRCHKRWLGRAENEPDKLRRVLADVRETKRRQSLENPGAYAEKLWRNVFAS
jgi:hypothetical protein